MDLKDIHKYFASIPHNKLKEENRRYIGDKKALYLMDGIIDKNGILPDGVGIPVEILQASYLPMYMGINWTSL